MSQWACKCLDYLLLVLFLIVYSVIYHPKPDQIMYLMRVGGTEGNMPQITVLVQQVWTVLFWKTHLYNQPSQRPSFSVTCTMPTSYKCVAPTFRWQKWLRDMQKYLCPWAKWLTSLFSHCLITVFKTLLFHLILLSNKN